jgi:CspA family cold shock protein
VDVDTKLKGTVKKFLESRGFGFISQENGPDVFFHITSVQGEYEPNEGDTVSFTLDNDRNGKPMASDVTII